MAVTARGAAGRAAKVKSTYQDNTYRSDGPLAARRQVRPRGTRGNTPTNPLAIELEPEILRERLALLERRRQAQGCTVVALARALGISRSTLARMLRGQQVRRGRAREFMTAEGLQRIEIALNLFARAAARQRVSPGPIRASRGRAVDSAHSSNALALVRRPASNAGEKKIRASARPDTALEVRPAFAAPAALALAAAPEVRVLVVEDDAPTVELYRLVLAEERAIRYSVDVARTAQECLERLRGARPYDVLLMDLGVADAHGESDEKSLLATFARQPRMLPGRILVVSGISPYRLQLKRTTLAALGAAFMPKPFDVDDLLIALRSLVMPDSEPAQGLSFFAAPKE